MRRLPSQPHDPRSHRPENLPHWRKIELAKHRLFYSLLRLALPLATKRRIRTRPRVRFPRRPDGAAAAQPRVMTGHASGLITINVAEADDAERERQRKSMGEPYRTLLGHFRHEIAHYYWDRLVRGRPADRGVPAAVRRRARGLRRGAAAPLRQRAGRRTGRNVSSPPTPARIRGRISPRPGRTISTWSTRWRPRAPSACGCGRAWPRAPISPPRSTSIPTAPRWTGIIDAWLPLTFAVNSINRSMGQPDLYPFVLPPPVIGKLTFIHDLIHAVGPAGSQGTRATSAARRRCRAQALGWVAGNRCG